MENNIKLKQSLILGALTSSFGIFISKVLGLLYYSPLTSLAGEANMAFYADAYSYYETILQISSAGIPFAIASLVAKYILKEDYKTALLIKRIGTSIIMLVSIFVAIGFALFATPLAKYTLGNAAPIEDINKLRNLFLILTISIIIVPFLSSVRGYIQGLKRLEIYAGSQVLEQFVRVFSIIILGYISVSLLKFDNIYAVYFAILAASIGAVVALLFTLKYQKQDVKRVEELAKYQVLPSKTKKEVINELLYIGIPYLFTSILSNGAALVNTTTFANYYTKVYGPSVYEYTLITKSILNAKVAKLSTIPSVLALGFGSGMIPYLSESLQKNDLKKIGNQIKQILDSSMFILIPLMLIFTFFSKDILFIMYGDSNLELGSLIFKVSNIQTFLGTLAPILSSVMLSLNLRKSTIFAMIISLIVKLVSFFPLVKYFGIYGVIYSGALYYGLQSILYIVKLYKLYKFNIKNLFVKHFAILVISIISLIPSLIIYYLIDYQCISRIIDIGYLGILGLLFAIIYYLITTTLQLPQKIFEIENIDIKSIINKLF